ncbi:MAG: hypothetical protein LBI95_00795 [Holosporales bacterium]|jgi:tRNA A37 threonylcarbamoyladenosine modification protein TsaB|nr:hypothetical protein [Holosporales bacterium]
MTFLSIFIKNKEFHIASDEFNDIYEVSESRALADTIPLFIKDVLLKRISHLGNSDFKKGEIIEVDEVVYPSGPASFTTMRIIGAVVKGMSVANPKTKFWGISNFLTLLSISNAFSKKGIIALPTMRGDYFTSEYINDKLSKMQLRDAKCISNYQGNTYFDNSDIFDNMNLACRQKEIVNSNLSICNSAYIKNTTEIEYGFTPEYKF